MFQHSSPCRITTSDHRSCENLHTFLSSNFICIYVCVWFYLKIGAREQQKGMQTELFHPLIDSSHGHNTENQVKPKPGRRQLLQPASQVGGKNPSSVHSLPRCNSRKSSKNRAAGIQTGTLIWLVSFKGRNSHWSTMLA